MIRDLVKEDAVARAVRWAEMLPTDATAEDRDRAEAILALWENLKEAVDQIRDLEAAVNDYA